MDIITNENMVTLVYSEIEERGIAGHHLDSMNLFYKEGIVQIITDVFSIKKTIKNNRVGTEEDNKIKEIIYEVKFTDVSLLRPSVSSFNTGDSHLMFPNNAMENNLNYSCQLLLSAEVKATGLDEDKHNIVEKTEKFENFKCSYIPCMLRSDLCNTKYYTREALKGVKEDPNNLGGYFIFNGTDWAINNLESLTYNSFHVYKNSHQKEIARGNFLSKPGDAYENSYQIILRYLNDDSITIEMTSNKPENFVIPFYLLFRAIGITNDADIIKFIVYDIDNKTNDPNIISLMTILEKSFNANAGIFEPIRNERNAFNVLNFLGEKYLNIVNSKNIDKNEFDKTNVINKMLTSIDRFVFPHISNLPEDRVKKLKFLGYLINKLLLVSMEVVNVSDRDSYSNKRIFPAGLSFAKAFKTHFNVSVINEINKKLENAFQSRSFGDVKLASVVTQALNNDTLETSLSTAIVGGSKIITVKTNKITNKMSTGTVIHNNDLNIISILRGINTSSTSASSSKQTERADDMRRVHPSAIGYVCVTQSAESGENVGLSKQMASMTSISYSTSSDVLKDVLYADPLLISLDKIPLEDIVLKKLTKVFVNGDWIGCINGSYDFVKKYKELRIMEKIHYLTTIVWSILLREIYFWVDAGRLLRPLTIVYNNYDKYVEAKGKIPFKTWHKLTNKHIEGLKNMTITMNDLRKEGVIEYISPEEQENAYLAYNMEYFYNHQNDITYKFTHIDVEQAIIGLLALSSPMPDHSNGARNTLFVNHRKKATGWFCLNYPYRMDKNTTMQWYGERPIVSAFTDSIVTPTGYNTIVLLALHGGVNQEDSITMNQSSIDCGLFNASQYNFELTTIENNENVGMSDITHTSDMKKGSTYENIENGLVKVGTVLKKGSVLVVKNIKKTDKIVNEHNYIDKSIIYKKEEPAIVERVVSTENNRGENIIKVKLRSNRPIIVGDKLCLADDHEIYTEDGFIDIKNITMENKVACFIDGKVKYKKPKKYYMYDCEEILYEINGNEINQKVTAGHKMYVSKDNINFELKTIRSIYDEKENYYYMKWTETKFDNMIYPFYRTEINSNPYIHWDDISLVHYNGFVYCLTVPGHLLFIRRKGIFSWTGNSSRTGNKGIVGNTLPRCDMPFTETGLVPDLIVNCHSIPTRMAINQIIECTLGLTAVNKGSFIDAMAFKNISIDESIEELEKFGIKYGGHTRMFNGITGQYLDSLMFIGPTVYQRIQKFILDEYYAVKSGPTSPMTHQPLNGKQQHGGIKLGYMEVDCLSASGSMRALESKFHKDSDGLKLQICKTCQKRAIYNKNEHIWKCAICGFSADLVEVNSTWSTNLLLSDLNTANMDLKLEVEPFIYPRNE